MHYYKSFLITFLVSVGMGMGGIGITFREYMGLGIGI